jgi:hypothetical protein
MINITNELNHAHKKSLEEIMTKIIQIVLEKLKEMIK